MAATSAETLFAETKCFACLGPVGTAQLLRIGLEVRTLLGLNAAAVVTPQALITYAKCYLCLDGVSEADAVELALLDQISQLI